MKSVVCLVGAIISLSFSEPVLVGEIEFGDVACDAGLRIGDLTGNGKMDFLNSGATEASGLTPWQVTALKAFDLEGNVLWRIGEANQNSCDNNKVPLQIYDIDADGLNEVVVVMEGELRILDGRTGEVERSRPLPANDAADVILFANFSGNETPQDIILKNKYYDIYVLNKDLDVLWTFNGNVGHTPWPYDFDGDGLDELMAGFHMLDSDGRELWSTNVVADHADAIWVGNVDQSEDNSVEIIIAGSNTAMFNPEGELLWNNTATVESQQVAIGDFLPGSSGLESAVIDRIDRSANGQDALLLYDSEGETLYKEDRPGRGCWVSIVETSSHWELEKRDLIYAYRRGCNVPPILYDGDMNEVARFPFGDNTNRYHQSLHWDICGDQREEFIIYDCQHALIYANGGCDLDEPPRSENPLPQPKLLYNWSHYFGGEYIPENWPVSIDPAVRQSGGKPVFNIHKISGTVLLYYAEGGSKEGYPASIEMADLAGKIIERFTIPFGESVALDPSRYAKGLFLLRARIGEKHIFKKLMIDL